MIHDMKIIHSTGRFILTGMVAILFAQNSFAQDKPAQKTEKLVYKNMVDSQHFIFSAQSAMPMRGAVRNLTSPYDVSITKGSLISNLPYFGRAYSATYNPSGSTLGFTSTKFSYLVTLRKKNEWEVIVKPEDNMEIQQYLFLIYDNGSASLNVTFNSRDPITFNGIIQPYNNNH
jgi:hypothetical protein